MSSEHSTTGIEMHEAHFPGRAAIESYGNGGFRFAGMSHKGSLLCLPSGIYAWNISQFGQLAPKSLERIVQEAEAIEVLLIGTGLEHMALPDELRTCLRENSISCDQMNTGAAVRTFNVLLSEKRAVAAALIAVE